MTREQARVFVNHLVALRGATADPKAAECYGVYPTWKSGVEYKVDERVMYNDVMYKVIIAHMSQDEWTPEAAPSLFTQVLIPDPEVIYDWVQPDSTNPYMIGDKVRHNGKIWVSTVDNNVWVPGLYGWDPIG